MLVSWEPSKVKISPTDVYNELKNGTPSIVTNVRKEGNKEMLTVGVVLLKPEQVDIVAIRIKEILEKANI